MATYKDIKKLDELVGEMYTKDKTLKDTKFGYAYKRFVEKNYIPTQKEFNEAIQMCWIDNTLEGKDKEVLKDPTDRRGFKFSKEGLKKVIETEKKLIEEYEAKEITIVPHIPSYVPPLDDLDEEEIELLNIFIK